MVKGNWACRPFTAPSRSVNKQQSPPFLKQSTCAQTCTNIPPPITSGQAASQPQELFHHQPISVRFLENVHAPSHSLVFLSILQPFFKKYYPSSNSRLFAIPSPLCKGGRYIGPVSGMCINFLLILVVPLRVPSNLLQA